MRAMMLHEYARMLAWSKSVAGFPPRAEGSGSQKERTNVKLNRRFPGSQGAVAAAILGAVALVACAPSPPPAPAAPAVPAAPGAAAPGAAAPQAAPGQPKRGGTLKIPFRFPAAHFDPQAGSVSGLYSVNEPVRETLFAYKQGADVGPLDWIIEPRGAEKWEMPDLSTFAVTLRSGVQWHDGKPFTAKDVQFTMERGSRKPESQRQHLYNWGLPIETPNDLTVKFNVKEPLASSILLTRLADTAAPILPAHLSDDEMKNRLVGTGPFVAKEFTRDAVYKYGRNPNYWDKNLPYVDELQLFFITDVAARLAALRSGQIDMEERDLKIRNIETLKQTNPELKTECWPAGGNGWFRLNLARKPLDDIRVRRALSLAIDRDALGRAVWGEPGVHNPIVPANMKQWALPEAEKNLPYNRYDPEKAKQLLAEAGYGPNNPLKLEGNVSAQLANYAKYMEIAKDQWTRVNVEMDLKIQEQTLAFATQPNRDFTIYAQGSRQLFDPDEYTYPWFHTNGERNYGGWGTSDLDKILERSRTARTDKERQEALWEVQRIVGDQVWVITFVDGQDCTAWQPYVKNFRPDVTSSFWNGRVYWIDKG